MERTRALEWKQDKKYLDYIDSEKCFLSERQEGEELSLIHISVIVSCLSGSILVKKKFTTLYRPVWVRILLKDHLVIWMVL